MKKINKQEALEKIIEDNIFVQPFMIGLFGDEPEYDFDSEAVIGIDNETGNGSSKKFALEVKADSSSIELIDNGYSEYESAMNDFMKKYDAEFYFDGILTSNDSITFIFNVPGKDDHWHPEKYLTPEVENEDMTNQEIIQWLIDAYVMLDETNEKGESEGKTMINALIDKLKKQEGISPIAENGTAVKSDMNHVEHTKAADALSEEISFLKHDRDQLPKEDPKRDEINKKLEELINEKIFHQEEAKKYYQPMPKMVDEKDDISEYKTSLEAAIQNKFSLSLKDIGFDDTRVKVSMDKKESVDHVVDVIGSMYNLVPTSAGETKSAGPKSYICLIKDRHGKEIGSYPVSYKDDLYVDEFLKAIGVKLRASDTKEVQEA